MARKQGYRALGESKKEKYISRKSFAYRGERSLKSPRAILLCEDTSSAYFYFKYFIREASLAIELEPKAVQKKQDREDGLNEIFVKANYFHRTHPERKVLMVYDLDEFYRRKEPKERNRKAYEEFLKENEKMHETGLFVYLDSFPCFEFWLLLHFVNTKKYYDSYDDLLLDLNRQCALNKFPLAEKLSKKHYSKSAKFWNALCMNLTKYLPTDKLHNAIEKSKSYRWVKGENSHSNIWKFFYVYHTEINAKWPNAVTEANTQDKD